MAEIQGQIAGMQQPQPIAPQQAAGDVPVMPDQMAQAPSVYEPKPKQERTIGERATGVVETLGARYRSNYWHVWADCRDRSGLA